MNSRSQPCLKFVVQTQPRVTQHLFCVTDGNLYFPQLIKGNLCFPYGKKSYSPHLAIQLLSSRHGLDRSSAPLIQQSINTWISETGNVETTPLLNVQPNENAFHLVNQQTQEARPFDLIFDQNPEAICHQFNLNRWKVIRFDRFWMRFGNIFPQCSFLPTFRSVRHCHLRTPTLPIFC